eukprot:XP_001696001.1 predicted protein [Chlamydomonas reinhardtii]
MDQNFTSAVWVFRGYRMVGVVVSRVCGAARIIHSAELVRSQVWDRKLQILHGY